MTSIPIPFTTIFTGEGSSSRLEDEQEEEVSTTSMCPLSSSATSTSTTKPPSSQLSSSRPSLASYFQSTPSTPSHTRNSSPLRNPQPSATTTPTTPILLNVLSAADDESILVVTVDDLSQKLYGGSQSGDIHVWDLSTLSLRARLTGHESAVLSLQLVKERGWLISSSSDGTVRVWHTSSLTLLYLIHPPSDNVGDILSLVWVDWNLLEGPPEGSGTTAGIGMGNFGHSAHPPTGRLFAGCQDTCIQVEFPSKPRPSLYVTLVPSKLTSSSLLH